MEGFKRGDMLKLVPTEQFFAASSFLIRYHRCFFLSMSFVYLIQAYPIFTELYYYYFFFLPHFLSFLYLILSFLYKSPDTFIICLISGVLFHFLLFFLECMLVMIMMMKLFVGDDHDDEIVVLLCRG